MYIKRALIIVSTTMLTLLSVSCSNTESKIIKVIAFTEVFGDGQKVSAAIVQYSDDILSSSLSPKDFAVNGRTITKVYANTEVSKASEGINGKYVIIELSPDDADAAVFEQQGRQKVAKDIELWITQTAKVETADNQFYPPTEEPVKNTAQLNWVVDDFVQREYTHDSTGNILQYNLFIPKGYDPAKSYPLVLFMHDASITGKDVITPLIQGNGATAWATPEDQEERPCFVLAPLFPTQTVNDNSEASGYLDVTISLIQELMEEYSINENRLYTTGQSGGCMMSIAMNIKYPDFFAASYLVAGQWDASLVAPMANDKLWIVVSEGDRKAFPGMNAITAAIKKSGAKVSHAVWDGRSTPKEFAHEVSKMINESTNVKYTVFKLGSTIPESLQGEQQNVNEHMTSWTIAYNIEGIRKWIFEQEKEES